MKTAQGIEVSGFGDQGLAEDLESYCRTSSAAMSHLRNAKQAGARIETQRAGNICHAEGTTVKVSMDACVDPATRMTSRPYPTDTVKHVRKLKMQVLQRLATTQHGHKPTDKFTGSQMRQNWGSKHAAKTPAHFLVAYIDALLWPDTGVGWSIKWKGGTMSVWKLCANEFVKTVPAVQHDADLSKKRKAEIMAAKFA